MSSPYERKSAAAMRQEQKDMISMAEAVQPTVAVMEPNWRAMIASQKTQVKTLEEILAHLDLLATTDQLTDYMGQQMEILKQHAEDSIQTMKQYQEAMMISAETVDQMCQQAVTSLEKQAGSVSEKFGKTISEQKQLVHKLTRRCFLISMIPSMILLILELMLRI